MSSRNVVKANLDDSDGLMQVAYPNDLDRLFERSNLTRLQFLYWISQKLRPESPFLNTILTCTIGAPINLDHFQNAFREVFHQCDALRTVITETNGIPKRELISDFPEELEFIDLTEVSEPLQALDAWLEKRASIPLQIDQRLFDSALLKISSHEYLWYLNQHHINADANSFFLTIERQAQVYDNLLNGKSLNYSEWSDFEAYVTYARKYRQSPQFAKAVSFWNGKLQPGPEPMKVYGKLPKKVSTRVERISHVLDQERSSKIRNLATQEGIYSVSEEYSLYNFFTALFFILLHQISGNQRLGLVTPVHNRFSAKLRNTVGLVMELCPLQIEMTEEDTFLSVINKVKREIRETMVYYQAGSSLSLQGRGFDVMFNMHPMPQYNLDGASLTLERVHPGHGSETLTLSVFDESTTGNFSLHFDFHQDVFTIEEQSQTVDLYEKLIDELIRSSQHLTNTDSPISQVLDGYQGKIPASDLLEIQPARSRKIVAPRDELESRLLHIWKEVLEIETISVDDKFFEIGGNSWLALKLFSKIHEKIGQDLPLSLLFQAATIEELSKVLREKTLTQSWSPIVIVNEGEKEPPFFCIHGAGGHVLIYDELAQHLGSEQPFYAIQARGIDGEENAACVEEMAEDYLEAIQEVQPQGPYLLGGYSFGGVVAFEMARQMIKQGQEVLLLAIIDVPAQSPYLKILMNLIGKLGTVFRWKDDVRAKWFLRLRHYVFRSRYFINLDNKAKRIYLRSVIRKMLKFAGNQDAKAHPSERHLLLDGFDPDDRSEENIMILEMFKLNQQAYEEYIPEKYSGDVVIFRSKEGYKNVDYDYSSDPYLGWAKVVLGKIKTFEIPGDHNSMIREPNVQILAEYLRSNLNNAYAQISTLTRRSG